MCTHRHLCRKHFHQWRFRRCSMKFQMRSLPEPNQWRWNPLGHRWLQGCSCKHPRPDIQRFQQSRTPRRRPCPHLHLRKHHMRPIEGRNRRPHWPCCRSCKMKNQCNLACIRRGSLHRRCRRSSMQFRRHPQSMRKHSSRRRSHRQQFEAEHRPLELRRSGAQQHRQMMNQSLWHISWPSTIKA